jgi:hypothetical protein
MKFLFRWLYRKMQNSQETLKLDSASPSPSPSRSNDFNSTPISFNIYKADGGHVVEVRHYDRRRDENSNSIYLITNDQNFGERLEHILTIEALKN